MPFSPETLRTTLKLVTRTVAVATAAWSALMLAEAWLLGSSPATLSVVVAALRLGLLAAFAGVPPLLLTRAALLLASRRAFWAQGAVVVTLTAIALPVALYQARVLAAGDGISTKPWVAWFVVGLTVAATAGLVSLALWDLRMSARVAPTTRLPLALLWRVPRGVVVGLGVLGALALGYGVVFELHYYRFFAAFLSVPLFALVTTLVSSSLPPPRRVTGSAALVCGVALSFALGPIDDATRAIKAQTASNTRLLLQVRRSEVSLLDLSHASSFRCEAPHATPARSPSPLGERVRNVILISVDALRPDVLGLERGGKIVAPHLRAFASRSVEYTNAQSTYPATLFAVGGALTGLSPSQLFFAPTAPPNLFRRTRGMLPHQLIVLPSSGWFTQRSIRELFQQGTTTLRKANAASQTRLFIERLGAARARGERTLAWLHYFEPHHPYEQHDAERFGDSNRERYLSEVAYLDEHIGALLEYLETAGFYDDSLIVLFSDHGEALGERGYIGHHVYLDDFLSDIVLMVRLPGLAPRRAEELVSIADIAPTVLDLLGLPGPADGAGQSLLEPVDEDRTIVAEAFPFRGNHLFQLAGRQVNDVEALRRRVRAVQRSMWSYEPKVSIVDAHHRLIASRESGDWELFRRHDDGREEPVQRGGAEERALLAKLKEWHRREAEKVYCRVAGATKR